MTSKEKATVLFNKFYKGNISNAKEDALICVDEILDIFDKWEEKQDDFVLSYGTIYWQEVKKEIENYDNINN